MPPPGMGAQQGMPQQGMPQQGMPQQGQGIHQPGMPGMMPPHGVLPPPSGPPPSGLNAVVLFVLMLRPASDIFVLPPLNIEYKRGWMRAFLSHTLFLSRSLCLPPVNALTLTHTSHLSPMIHFC